MIDELTPKALTRRLRAVPSTVADAGPRQSRTAAAHPPGDDPDTGPPDWPSHEQDDDQTIPEQDGDGWGDPWPDQDGWPDEEAHPPSIRHRGRAEPAPAARGRRLPVRTRAVVAVFLLALAVLAVLLTRGDPSDSAGTVLPARPSPSHSPSHSAPTPAPPQALVAVPAVAGGSAAAVPRSAGLSPGALVVVDVAGKVRRPGLVRLPSGSRVWDAMLAAGGSVPPARLDRINLARPLVDGEQVLVPGPDDPVSAPSAAPGVPSAAGPGAPVDLNAATVADLDALPGVGPVLANRILTWRSQHGRFSGVQELGEVQGIGSKLFDHLRPLVRV